MLDIRDFPHRVGTTASSDWALSIKIHFPIETVLETTRRDRGSSVPVYINKTATAPG